uniref:DYW domain-containing protein n=1 Tax=Nymphaea colorata TaxID=210225 RepID=A0A5K1ASM3_9MAGN
MQSVVEQRRSLFSSLIRRCSSILSLKSLHALLIREGLDQDGFLASKLLQASAVSFSGHMDYAHLVFSRMPNPNLFVYNTMLQGYSRSNSAICAISLYRRIHGSGLRGNSFTAAFVLKVCGRLVRVVEGNEIRAQVLKMGLDSDLAVANGILKWAVACGRLDEARKIFDEMAERDPASWSTVIAGYSQNGMPRDALALFREMQRSSMEVDGFTLASVLGACAQLGSLDLGRWVHAYIDKHDVPVDVVLGTSLVDMYSKCGGLAEALKVFNNMPEKDALAWSSMIGGLAIHGLGERALEIFAQMKRSNLRPNCVTFTSVLFACSHSGLLEEGKFHFDSMSRKYGIAPQIEHYGCMVDLLCRAGQTQEAYDFIMSMPIKPNEVLWRALLNCCRIHGDVELSSCISKHLLELDPHGGDNYVLVSNVYASSGRWSDVTRVRGLMKKRKAEKEHGYSMIELNNTFHEFVMGDESHPHTAEIYEMLDKMNVKLKSEGYVATTADVLHDIDEEEKENALGLHSERLAIAFGILQTSDNQPLRVIKNLRVCGDCHSVIKLLSRVYSRVITVRDRVRFHHFKQGQCSCKDYW